MKSNKELHQMAYQLRYEKCMEEVRIQWLAKLSNKTRRYQILGDMV